MRTRAVLLVAVLVGSVAAMGATAATDESTRVEALPRPPAGRAVVGGKWTQLGRAMSGEDVELLKKRAGKQPKLFAKVKTNSKGNYVFKAVPPGTYRLSIGIVVEAAKTEGKTCGLRGFVTGLSIAGTDNAGREVILSVAESEFFTVKAAERVTKDIVYTCK